VINNSVHGGRNGFKASVRMLWESRNPSTVIHSITLSKIKICTVAFPRRLHFAITRRIIVQVIDCEKKRVLSFEWEGKFFHGLQGHNSLSRLVTAKSRRISVTRTENGQH
jgi:hypothetical protein